MNSTSAAIRSTSPGAARLPPHFLALCWSLLMASSFIVSAWITDYASPLAVTFLRFLFAFIVMTPIFLWQRRQTQEPLFASVKASLKLLLVSAGLVGFFVCLFSALATTSPLNTSVLYTLVPMIGAALGLLFGNRTAKRQWLGFIIGSLGAMTVLLLRSGSQFSWQHGDVIYLLGCFLLALHVVAVQRWCRDYTPFGGAYRIMLFGTGLLLPLVIIFGDLYAVQWQSGAFQGMLTYLTLGTTLATFVLQQRVIITGGAGMLLGMSYTIPVWVACYGVLSGSLVALLSPGFIVGTALIITAQWLISNRKREDGNGQNVSDTAV